MSGQGIGQGLGDVLDVICSGWPLARLLAHDSKARAPVVFCQRLPEKITYGQTQISSVSSSLHKGNPN